MLGPMQVHFRSELASLRFNGAAAQNELRVPGRISQVSYLGAGYRCEIKTECGAFFIDHPGAVGIDDAVMVSIPAIALLIYPRDAARVPRALH